MDTRGTAVLQSNLEQGEDQELQVEIEQAGDDKPDVGCILRERGEETPRCQSWRVGIMELKIDVYSNVYNEAFMMPYFLRHYETFADRIFIWDDESTDGTLDILAKHPKVTVLPMEFHGSNDHYWVEKLFPQYEQISRGVADWVMIADADEFIYHPRLLEVLEQEKTKGTKLIQCWGYSMVADRLPTTTGQIYDEIKFGLHDKWMSKWSIFSPDIYLRFHRGRHGRPIRNRSGGANRAAGIKLLHYRYIGERYFEERLIRNRERLEVAYHEGIPYHRGKWHNMPDGTRASPIDWFLKHKAEAVNVVDEA